MSTKLHITLLRVVNRSLSADPMAPEGPTVCHILLLPLMLSVVGTYNCIHLTNTYVMVLSLLNRIFPLGVVSTVAPMEVPFWPSKHPTLLPHRWVLSQELAG